MILRHVSIAVQNKDGKAYHRLVKTTPKPRATKNSNGELGPLPPPPPVGDGEGLAVGGVGAEEPVEVILRVTGELCG